MNLSTILSLSIGVLVVVFLVALLYGLRNRIAALRNAFSRGAASTRERLARGVDTRYRQAVIDLANSWHLAGHRIPLEQVAVVPRFYGLPEPYNPLLDEPEGYNGPLNFVPLTPDWPQVMGNYPINSIPLERILRGPDNIAVLGLPGSGRTVTLGLMAIFAARQKEDNQPGGLTEIARLPVLLHAADLDLSAKTWGANVDPLDPMLAAAGIRLKSLAEQFLNAVQRQFATGYGLILIDGWDEIPSGQQAQASDWLRALVTSYPGNKVVVAGLARGYRSLQELGFAPAFLRPWSQAEVNEMVGLWSEAWPTIAGTAREPAPPIDPETARRVMRGHRGRSPQDIALKVWASFANDDPGQGRRGWFSAYIQRTLPAPALRGALERMGERDLATPAESGLSLEEVTALVDSTRSGLAGQPTMSTPDFVFSLTNEVRLLTERGTGRLTFSNPLIGAYLAAESLKQASLPSWVMDGSPMNEEAMIFLAQMVDDATPYVEARLAEASTILHDRILSLALCAADADPRAGWRAPVFKRLAQIMLSPAEFPLVRERAMAAMVASRDTNVGYIFRQGLKHDDPRVRIVSALGMGALGDPETVTALAEATKDSDPIVSVCAVLGLGAMGTKPALEHMIEALLTGIEMARRAATEMMATNTAGEGHDLLREAIKEQDPMTRRSAAFGLERVGEEWVIPLLKEAELRDDQWLVRAAAQIALQNLSQPRDDIPRHRPLPEESPWLGQWLAERDETLSPGPGGMSQLVRALQEGNEATRLAAAEALGALGATEGVTPLYSALHDDHAEVRDAAYRALASTSIVVGRTFPGVI